MVCFCCGGDAKTKTQGKGAPKGESMNRAEMSGDKEAVDWWRHKQNSMGEEADSPLRQPYEITKQPPLHPKNGSILNQAPPVKVPEISSSPEKSAFKRLAPKVQRSGMLLSLSQDEKDDTGQVEKIVSIVSKEDKSMDYFVESPKNILASQEKEQSSPMESEKDESETAAASSPEKESDEATESDMFACFVGPSMLEPSTAEPHFLGSSASGPTASADTDDIGDHLSDVGSDVDPVARDRYLQACKLLKAGLIDKGKKLDPNERSFILSLLNDAEAADADTGSVISAEHISVLENAAFRLDNNPAGRAGETEMAAALEVAAMSMDEDYSNSPSREIYKNPHTATRRKSKKSKFSMPSMCGPKSMKEVESPADIVLLVKEEDDFEEPDLEEESPAVDGGKLARFDGWPDHKSMELPFRIIGADHDRRLQPRVMTPPMMEALRGFLPYQVTESNFWLKFSLVRDGASLATLLATIRASTYTFIGVETTHGEVFGSFTGTAWRSGSTWFGNGESFLWSLKKSRLASAKQSDEGDFENEMEVYPYTGYDNFVQYCTSRTIAVGGGDWYDHDCPFVNEPKGIGFMIDGDLVGGETNSCATFSNPRLCKKTSLSNEFAIENLEVWTLTPFENEEDAAQLEMQKLFIEQHAQRGAV
jgi:hypothetical protein